jgi:hypothetical protein
MADHRLAGTVKPSRHGTSVSTAPVDGSIPEPLDLSPDARVIWNAVAPARVNLGWYTAADAVGVGQWCELTVTLRTMNEKMRKAAVDGDMTALGKIGIAFSNVAREWRTIGRNYGLDLVGREAMSVVSAGGDKSILDGAPAEFVPAK